MDEITIKEVEEAIALAPERKEEEVVTQEDFDKMIIDMENPVNSQKEIAVKVKIFLEKRINKEMEQKGVLGDNTRKWIETYTNLLEKLKRAINGDK